MSNERATNAVFPYEIVSVDEKTKDELLEDFTGERTSYVRVGPEKYIFPIKYAKEAQDYYNIEVKSDDIWIVTIPRSGTTLTQELVWLIGNDLNYKKAFNQPLSQRFPFLEFDIVAHDDVYDEILQENAQSETNKQMLETIFIEGWKLLPKMKSQRYIKTHFPFSLLPRDWKYKKCKTIYVARNPKNVAISYFYLCKLFRTLGYCGDFAKFWDYFEKDLLPWLPYWSHVKEAWKMRHEPHILFLFYEDIIRDMPGTIDKVAEFLGKTLTVYQKTELEAHLRFENFQKNTSVNFDNLRDLHVTNEDVPSFIRQGNKSKKEREYSPELNERVDKWIEENIKKTDIMFPNV
ncbi:Sulfotransferase 4 [Carabus blaptoides fortunei]